MTTIPEEHDPDSCPFGHIDGICAGEALGYITEQYEAPMRQHTVQIEKHYTDMIHRNPDGSDPLVQEPKGKP
jgi:hypothetical protein